MSQVRPYRSRICRSGQSSGKFLSEFVRDIIKDIGPVKTMIDVGCGTGKQSDFIKKNFPEIKITGLDFSEATCKFLEKSPIFEKVYYASSASLPVKDKEFEVALSMENLEHLYYEDVQNAMEELKRVSNIIILTTPNPNGVIDTRWLEDEIIQAGNDKVPMNEHDFMCMTSAVHKSVIYPDSLLECGFKQVYCKYYNHSVFYGTSDNLDMSKLRFDGLLKSDELDGDSYLEKYECILHRSLALRPLLIKNNTRKI